MSNDSVEVNLMPFGSNYFRDYSSFSKPDSGGNFHFEIKSAHEKFVLLRYLGKEQWLIISPGRNLFVTIDTNTNEIFKYAGPGAPGNKLLQSLRPKELYFAKNVGWGDGTSPYIKVSEDSMKTLVFPMVMKSLDSAMKVIGNAMIPKSVKDALQTEIRFYYFPQFVVLAWNGWHIWHSRNHYPGSFFKIMDTVLEVYGIPSRKVVESGIPSAFDYMSGGYWGLNRMKANFGYGYAKNKENEDLEFKKIYKYDRTEDKQAVDSLGYSYAEALAAYHFLPSYAYERWLTMNIQFWSDDGDLLNASRMQMNLIRYFPNDKYIKPFSLKIAALQKSRNENRSNPKINFRADSKTVATVRQLVEPYKDKVVFLDFWGTWCGYCLQEIRDHGEKLKQQYKDKDVVFLYVALDDDGDKEKWENDIYLYDMEGEHIRIPRNDIGRMNAIRDSLDVGDTRKHRDEYPTYYIFDRSGIPVVKNAKRPGAGAELYKQLNNVINY